MARKLLLTVVTALSVASTQVEAHAQVVGQEPQILAGVEAVDAQISLAWDEPITANGGPGEAVYRQAFEDSFQKGLVAGGVRIDESAPNYLWCNIALLYRDGSVSAAQTVEYHVPTGDGEWAILWTQFQVFVVGVGAFSGGDDGPWCAEEFVKDWEVGNRGG